MHHQTYEIIPHFVSKQQFLQAFPTLYYGTEGEWLVVMTPDERICALTLKAFPGSSGILQRYKKHTLIEKNVPLKKQLSCLLVGTPFQHQVWSALLKIPRGKVVSYQDLAHTLKRPKAVRAIGNAVGANPISPLIPCHRVIGSHGGLGGYYWGLEAKRTLLQEEGVKIEALKRQKSSAR